MHVRVFFILQFHTAYTKMKIPMFSVNICRERLK